MTRPRFLISVAAPALQHGRSYSVLASQGPFWASTRVTISFKRPRRLAADEQLGDRVRFETRDLHKLGIASEFDAVVAHTLFSHLDDPAKVLAEMRRVVNPGGVIGTFDGDYASLTFELADELRSRCMDEMIVASLVTNPRILRRSPRLLKDARFAVDAIMPSIIAEVGVADFWKSSV
jgi:SAM-dependent methyltransferase